MHSRDVPREFAGQDTRYKAVCTPRFPHQFLPLYEEPVAGSSVQSNILSNLSRDHHPSCFLAVGSRYIYAASRGQYLITRRASSWGLRVCKGIVRSW